MSFKTMKDKEITEVIMKYEVNMKKTYKLAMKGYCPKCDAELYKIIRTLV